MSEKCIVKVPNNTNADYDFIAFSFDGYHSYEDLHIVRVSDGNRYNDTLFPTLNDKTAETPNGDGTYLISSNHKSKQFNINFAYENLTDADIRILKQVFSKDKTAPLWFAEHPYRVYDVVVTGAPQLKYIPFDSVDSEGNYLRVYKGEGTVQFTAFYPYAHTPDWVVELKNRYIFQKEITLYSIRYEGGLMADGPTEMFAIDSKGEKLRMYLLLGQYFFEQNSSQARYVKEIFYYADQPCKYGFSYTESFSGGYIPFELKQSIEILKRSGNLADAYKSFSNYSQWIEASNLPLTDNYNPVENYGQLPVPFIASKETAEKDDKIQVGNNYIKIAKDCEKIEWDSKTGIVTATSEVLSNLYNENLHGDISHSLEDSTIVVNNDINGDATPRYVSYALSNTELNNYKGRGYGLQPDTEYDFSCQVKFEPIILLDPYKNFKYTGMNDGDIWASARFSDSDADGVDGTPSVNLTKENGIVKKIEYINEETSPNYTYSVLNIRIPDWKNIKLKKGTKYRFTCDLKITRNENNLNKSETMGFTAKIGDHQLNYQLNSRLNIEPLNITFSKGVKEYANTINYKFTTYSDEEKPTLPAGLSDPFEYLQNNDTEVFFVLGQLTIPGTYIFSNMKLEEDTEPTISVKIGATDATSALTNTIQKQVSKKEETTISGTFKTLPITDGIWSDFKNDSKVCGLIFQDFKSAGKYTIQNLTIYHEKRPIKVSGNPLSKIPPGEFAISEGVTLNYHYWYY